MSEPATPSITFRVNLALLSSEDLGANTNSSSPAMLHPDQHQSSPDNGRFENANRVNTRSTWFPNQLLGNRPLKHGDEFTVNGLKALYIRDNYAAGFARSDMAFLEVV